MDAIVYDNELDSIELSQILWEVIEPIKKGDTTNYCEPVKHPTKDMWMCQIIKGGYYWESIEAKLIQLDLINNIQQIGADWRENLIS